MGSTRPVPLFLRHILVFEISIFYRKKLLTEYKSSDLYCSLSLKSYQGSLLYYTSIDYCANDKDKIKIKKARNQILRSYIIKFSINLLSTMCINPFSTNVPFLSLPENIRKPPVFQCFQGVKKWNMDENRLKFISTKT